MSTVDLKTQLKKFYREVKRIPSIREVCQLLGKSDTYKTQAQRLLKQLVAETFLEQDDKGAYLPGKLFFSYPLYTGVKASTFAPAGDVQDLIMLEQLVIPDPDRSFMVTVSGESMINAGIDDGDIVVVVPGQPRLHDIVVAELNNSEYTVKYYEKDNDGSTLLRPANPKFHDIHFRDGDEIKVVGIVKRCIKQF